MVAKCHSSQINASRCVNNSCRSQETIHILRVDDLEKDAAALRAELPKLSADAGKYALVFEQKIVGIFPTYEEALTKGYDVAGMKSFLVEQISQIPQVQQFSRVVGFECLTSH